MASACIFWEIFWPANLVSIVVHQCLCQKFVLKICCMEIHNHVVQRIVAAETHVVVFWRYRYCASGCGCSLLSSPHPPMLLTDPPPLPGMHYLCVRAVWLNYPTANVWWADGSSQASHQEGREETRWANTWKKKANETHERGQEIWKISRFVGLLIWNFMKDELRVILDQVMLVLWCIMFIRSFKASSWTGRSGWKSGEIFDIRDSKKSENALPGYYWG